MTKCCECGKKIKGRLTTENAVFYDGKYWCKECFENKYFKCEECGEYHRTEEAYETVNGDYICRRCKERFYIRCSDCGYYERSGYLYETYDECLICENCRNDNYYQCEHCGNYVSIDDYYEEYGRTLCPNCYENYSEVIYDYHDFDDFCPYKMPDESRTNPTYGFEIEVAGERRYADEIMDLLNDHAVAMNDSSVDGFEIVTQPMTEQYFIIKFVPMLEKALKFMDNHGFKGHNKGGIHIHVNKEAFDLHMIRNLVTILYGNRLDRNTWLALSQRKQGAMDSWARMTGCRRYEDIDLYENIDYERHTALNYDDRTETYEFRIFNSNTRIERILKNFEIVLALMAYSKEEKEGYADTKGFLKFIDSRKLFYPNLSAFVQEKGIIEHYNKIYTEEELEAA